MRRSALIFLAVLTVACGARTTPDSAAPGDILLPRDSDVIEDVVPRNATLEALLSNHDVSRDTATGLIAAVRNVFDPHKLRVNQAYSITRTLDGLLREFRYEIDADRFLRVVATRLRDGGTPAFEAEVVEYPKEVLADAVETSISRDRPSLVAALNGEGENVYLALKLEEALGGMIDFNSDLQDGDHLRVLFDRVYHNGQPTGYGNLRAAVLENDGRTLVAIPFEVQGKLGWYDGEGRSLKRKFLPSPLTLATSISSGYSMNRRHPVTGNFRAHPAIDYRAAYGQPVVAVAAGEVVFAQMSGASGRLVRIRHDDGYETLYLHLSAFKVKKGQRVSQGQVIGNVGNTGLVTATHLDFRMKKNGAYVNPLNVFRSLPPGDPIPATLMPDFFAERDRLFADMDGRIAAARNANAHNH
ncbi:MAG: M23 family metallopeptidase [Vicinamibacterales bacterium]